MNQVASLLASLLASYIAYVASYTANLEYSTSNFIENVIFWTRQTVANYIYIANCLHVAGKLLYNKLYSTDV